MKPDAYKVCPICGRRYSVSRHPGGCPHCYRYSTLAPFTAPLWEILETAETPQ